MAFILVLHNMRGRDVYSQAIFRGVKDIIGKVHWWNVHYVSAEMVEQT